MELEKGWMYCLHYLIYDLIYFLIYYLIYYLMYYLIYDLIYYLVYDKNDGCVVIYDLIYYPIYDLYTKEDPFCALASIPYTTYIRRGILFALLHLSHIRPIYEGGPFFALLRLSRMRLT